MREGDGWLESLMRIGATRLEPTPEPTGRGLPRGRVGHRGAGDQDHANLPVLVPGLNCRIKCQTNILRNKLYR